MAGREQTEAYTLCTGLLYCRTTLLSKLRPREEVEGKLRRDKISSPAMRQRRALSDEIWHDAGGTVSNFNVCHIQQSEQPCKVKYGTRTEYWKFVCIARNALAMLVSVPSPK